MQAAIAAAQERTERRMLERQHRAGLDHRSAAAWLSFPECDSRFFWLVPGVNHLGRPDVCDTDMQLARDHLQLTVNGTAVTVLRVRHFMLCLVASSFLLIRVSSLVAHPPICGAQTM